MAVPKRVLPGFWASEDSWPRDSSGYVFLARAVNQFGRALFGAEWSGEEPPALEAVLAAISALQHDAGIDDLAGHMRFQQVQTKIATLCVDGALESVLRPVKGGEFTPVPSVWWRTERLAVRFSKCRLDPDNPFETKNPLAGHLIFLESKSLRQALTAVVKQKSEPASAKRKKPKSWAIESCQRFLAANYPDEKPEILDSELHGQYRDWCIEQRPPEHPAGLRSLRRALGKI